MIRQELNPETCRLDTKQRNKNCRYVWMANPDIPLCDLASLNWVSHRVPSSPALDLKREEDRKKKKREVLHLFRCYTHTHTCSEQSLRILMWNASYVQNIPITPDRSGSKKGPEKKPKRYHRHVQC